MMIETIGIPNELTERFGGIIPGTDFANVMMRCLVKIG